MTDTRYEGQHIVGHFTFRGLKHHKHYAHYIAKYGVPSLKGNSRADALWNTDIVGDAASLPWLGKHTCEESVSSMHTFQHPLLPFSGIHSDKLSVLRFTYQVQCCEGYTSSS